MFSLFFRILSIQTLGRWWPYGWIVIFLTLNLRFSIMFKVGRTPIANNLLDELKGACSQDPSDLHQIVKFTLETTFQVPVFLINSHQISMYRVEKFILRNQKQC